MGMDEVGFGASHADVKMLEYDPNHGCRATRACQNTTPDSLPTMTAMSGVFIHGYSCPPVWGWLDFVKQPAA